MLNYNVKAIALCFFVYLYGSFAHAQETITVAVASSFYPQAEHYSQQFEIQHNIKVRLIAGSTGRLFNQIKQGAPFDVFIAAGEDSSALLMGKKSIIAHGYLGLKLGSNTVQNVHILLHDDIQKIAIANPQVAPFGKLTQALLEHENIWQPIKSKLVYAQNAMQANMMVEQGLVDAGFVAITDKEMALAQLPYQAVLLSKKSSAYLYISGLTP